MDIAKVRDLTDAELGSELVTQRRQLYDLRFQLATRQLTDHSQLTQTRRTIARLLTVITERGLDERSIVPAAPETRKAPTRGRGRVRGAAASAAKSESASTKADKTAKAASGGKKE
jgi:large subunit ribosomal protein L29